MDENAVKAEAQQHADATVAGDLRTAGSSLTKEAMGQAGEVMKAMPGKLTGCEITGVATEGDEMVVTIRYDGEAGQTSVESRWAERDGAPKIVALSVLS